MNARTLNIIQGTIQGVRFMAEPAATKAANANDPAKPTPSNRFIAFLGAWTEASYNAWAKTDKTPYV